MTKPLKELFDGIDVSHAKTDRYVTEGGRACCPVACAAEKRGLVFPISCEVKYGWLNTDGQKIPTTLNDWLVTEGYSISHVINFAAFYDEARNKDNSHEYALEYALEMVSQL